jgi:LPS export ABC transporter protein LptC
MMRSLIARVGGVALGAAALMLGVSACTEPTDATVAGGDLEDIAADNVIFGMVMFMSTNGVRQGHVEADTAYLFSDSSTAKLHQMRIVFYDDNGNEKATVTGTSGEWDQDSGRMTAWGDVLLEVHTDGRTIESSELNYDPQRDMVWSDSATVQTLANGTVTRGSAFESDMDFQNVRISNIRGAIGR